MNPEEIEKLEKRRAAFHEAAHAVVMHALGEQLHRVRIFPNESPGEDEKTWLGQTQGRPFDPGNRTLIGLAGTIAEELDQDPDMEPEDYYEYLQEKIISPSETDWRWIGEYSLGVVEQTLDLIKENWSGIQAVAGALLESGELEWNEVANLMVTCGTDEVDRDFQIES